jgi:hypothetical protein
MYGSTVASFCTPGKVPFFSMLPHDLRKDPDLKGHDKAILLAAALLEYARKKASCWPSNRTLAEDLGCCVRTVQLALRALQAAGWIRIEYGADNPTGRLIILVWREAHCAPSRGPIAPPPAAPVAPEAAHQKEREKKRPVTAAGFEGPPPPAGEPEEPDLATLHQWAEGSDHVLRRIALARLEELRVEAVGQTVQVIAGPTDGGPARDELRQTSSQKTPEGGITSPCVIPHRPGARFATPCQGPDLSGSCPPARPESLPQSREAAAGGP